MRNLNSAGSKLDKCLHFVVVTIAATATHVPNL